MPRKIKGPQPVSAKGRLVAVLDGMLLTAQAGLGELSPAGQMEAAASLLRVWPGEIAHEQALGLLREAWRTRAGEELPWEMGE